MTIQNDLFPGENTKLVDPDLTAMEDVGRDLVELKGLKLDTLEQMEGFVSQAQEIETGARLLTAIAIHRIVKKELYRPAYSSAAAYFADSDSRLKIPRDVVTHYYNAADFYLRNRDALKRSGFAPVGKFHNLRYAHLLEGRLEAPEIVKAVCTLTTRDFMALVRGDRPHVAFDRPGLEVSIDDSGISVAGSQVIRVKDVLKIVQAGNEPYLVEIQGPAEKKIIARALKEFRQGK